MPVHPEIQKILDIIPPSEVHEIDVEAHRKMFNAPRQAVEERVQLFNVEDRVISTEETDLTLRIYTPEERDTYSILVFFHGGAYYGGNLESHDDVVREIAKESGYKVIAVDYRLAPEHPYPAAMNDCYAATKWVTENRDELQWDGKPLAICGDSSGGSLAASISYLARARNEFNIGKQILIYPALDIDFSERRYPSLTENGKGYFLDVDMLPIENAFYLEGVTDAKNPLVSPIHEEDLTNLPATFIITAEYDPFRDEGELYAKNMEEQEGEVQLTRYEGATHGFLGRYTHLDEFKVVYKEIADFLNK